MRSLRFLSALIFNASKDGLGEARKAQFWRQGKGKEVKNIPSLWGPGSACLHSHCACYLGPLSYLIIYFSAKAQLSDSMKPSQVPWPELALPYTRLP